jgi:ribosome-associated protein
VRQARKDHLSDAKSVSQGLAPRQGRAFRELFHLIKSQLTASHA